TGTVFIGGNEAGIFVRYLNGIRCLTIILEPEFPTQCDTGGRHLLVISHLYDVQPVDTPVRHHATCIIPEPAEMGESLGIHSKTIGVEWALLSRSQPHIPVEL